MAGVHRSGCPINLSLEMFGDRWSLLILRDMISAGGGTSASCRTAHWKASRPTSWRPGSNASSNWACSPSAPTPLHKQKAIYSLTEASIQRVPVMAALGSWGRRWLPVSEELAIRARLLDEGGPELHERFMAELSSSSRARFS